ncbi:hypothetical protein Pan44_08130 [Caulifigura coniformis]|uniref:Uncharacterized protein n=1 Tax=Caulifigura coniformis TaxID=2527983 RepID=A0A517S9J8_9PLAN|nr:DUF6573 family protein [Caulifigura coniformis]QDT52801.1 hypothetical protein Pan44_08130 [Caulifigura coniformis]
MDDLLHAYTRKEAIADGVLIDVSHTAEEAGFRYPVALTSGVWAECVRVPEEVSYQDESGRLWDILTMLRYFIQKDPNQSLVRFIVQVQNDERPPQPVHLKALCGPGDNGEPVITVLLPHED